LKKNTQNNESGKPPRSNLAITILALGLIIVFTFMLTDSFKQVRAQDNLRKQIDRGTQELASMEQPDPGLPEKLEKIQSENASVKASLSAGMVNPREIIEAVLETAGNCELMSNNLTADKWLSQNIGDSTYRIMSISLNLKGTTFNLLRFVEKLENKQSFPSLIVNHLSLADSEANDTQKLSPDSPAEIEAKLSVSIVARTESASEEY
jgi:hypothetical protein